MKNQFIISESERQRILSLHESSTKKQYLNVLTEQEQFYKGSDGKVGKLVAPQILPAGATKITQQEYDTAIKTQTPVGDGGTTTTTTVKPGAVAETWLKYLNDKTYEYLKKDNKWFARRVGTTKEFDLSSNPKYKKTVENLNNKLNDGKATAGGEVKTATLGTAITPQGTKLMDELEKNPAAKSVIDALKKANFDFNQMKPEQLLPTIQKQFGDFLQQNPNTLPQIKTDIENLMKIKLPEITPATNVAVKNETLPGAPVYYPWIQDGKVNTEKLKQSIEDNSINKWLDELKKLTPELLTKVRQDLVSSGIPTNLTTTKGTGLYYNLNDLLKTAEKMVANAQPQGGTETLQEIPGAGQNF